MRISDWSADVVLFRSRHVVVYDSLERANVEENLAWLRERHGPKIDVEIADTRDAYTLQHAVSKAAQVFHFAAQVAVTTSLADPVADFEINARGTLNLLEALRARTDPPPLILDRKSTRLNSSH